MAEPERSVLLIRRLALRSRGGRTCSVVIMLLERSDIRGVYLATWGLGNRGKRMPLPTVASRGR